MAIKKKGKKPTDWRIVCFIAGCMTLLEIVALLKGINGTLFTIVIGALAAFVGLNIENPINTKR